MKTTATAVFAALSVAVLSFAAADPKPTIADLAFLAGSWETAGSSRHVEERWIPPAGGAMLGLSRTVAGGKMVEFEFLRIVERAEGIFYVAQPNGGKATEFRLTKITGEEALFENPEHDFPKTIAYSRKKDGSLVATIAGDGGKKFDFVFRPAAEVKK